MEELTAAAFLPKTRSLAALKEAAKACRGCPLYKNATQTVFGEGRKNSRVVVIGSIPGDQEDLQGRPFVGPAGRLLNQALEEAGIDRAQTYVTNAVKHFKFLKQGRYRLHRNPGGREMRACRPWLEAELSLIKPRIAVGLGTIAGQTLLGRPVVLKNDRGKFVESPEGWLSFLTIHPSALLRLRGAQGDYKTEYKHFVEDLRKVREKMAA